MVAVIRHGDGFRESLGLVVDPARADWVHVSPVAFRLRAHFRIAVALRGGGLKKFGFLGHRQPQRVVGSERSHLQRLNGELQVVRRAGRRSKMQHRIHGPGDLDVFRNVLLGETKSGIRKQVRNIRISAGDEVVHAKDVPALFDEVIAKM